MKTFEEKFTAWVDGQLTGPELIAFEKELEAHPDAPVEKQAALDLGDLLRTHVAAPPLRNADFFNHQLLLQIEAQQPEAARTAATPAHRPVFWSLRRMAFSGAFLLFLATAFYFAAVPQTRREVRQNEKYVSNILTGRYHDPNITANILNARSDDPGITATSFYSKRENVNVLWLDGLNYMPQNHKLK